MARSKTRKSASNTGEKQAKLTPKELSEINARNGKATQLKKGYDPRRNMKGRPKTFDQFRKLAQDIAEQVATMKDGTPIKWNDQEITFAEFILLSWVTDKKYLEKFSDVAFGKVPDRIETDKGEKIKGYLLISPEDWKKPNAKEETKDDRDSDASH